MIDDDPRAWQRSADRRAEYGTHVDGHMSHGATPGGHHGRAAALNLAQQPLAAGQVGEADMPPVDDLPIFPVPGFCSQRGLPRRILPPIRLHDLRHGAASLMPAAGVEMKVVQETLGHTSSSFTADTYTSVFPEVAMAAAEKTAALLLAEEEDQAEPGEVIPLRARPVISGTGPVIAALAWRDGAVSFAEVAPERRC
ncbi:tyrosine-type recombinase/integrase [Nonomuraea jabiensis]|uniref:tyrosine-type recombinase/integrase n=1 Tax=Nonomuraea jabiensis TaxID=882448 RepID=UPI003676F34A